MSAPLTVADVLERAAEKLEAPGAWTQRAFSRNADGTADIQGDDDDPETNVAASAPVCWCVLGAIADVVGADPMRWQTFSPSPGNVAADAREVLCRHLVGSVENWNDAPERNQPEVVAALRRAATLARAGEA